MEKNKETKRFDLMEFGSALGREEMKKLMAGSEGGGTCPASILCPDGTHLYCDHPQSGNCYSENGGTCLGYINCGTGYFEQACWEEDPTCAPD